MNNESNFLMYQTENGDTKIQVRLEGETVWMTQKAMAELFQKGVPTINEHIKNIYAEGELTEEATIRKNRIVQVEGSREVEREVTFYNLEVIIAVGYRVRSHRGTQFRQWATERLNEYMVKGFTMDDERLKEMRNIGADYFDELLERIRDIRASERRFYYKITEGSKRIQPKELYKLTIKLPSLREQQRQSKILECSDKEIYLLEKELETYRKQKQGLMQLLLTGKVRVKV
ncbi:RhuM family protein [Bacillus licheniformis]